MYTNNIHNNCILSTQQKETKSMFLYKSFQQIRAAQFDKQSSQFRSVNFFVTPVILIEFLYMTKIH